MESYYEDFFQAKPAVKTSPMPKVVKKDISKKSPDQSPTSEQSAENSPEGNQPQF
jgi:hypothetical protein